MLVTAGASGIGLATARAFAREGARVHVCDVDAGALDRACRQAIRLSRTSCATSRTRSSLSGRLFDAALTRRSAASTRWSTTPASPDRRRACEDVALADWERTLAVNLTGQFLCAQRAIPLAQGKSRNASIANLSSAAGRFGFPMRTPYAASKWGVIGFTKSLSIELGPFGIRVNAICPGSVAGPRIDAVFANKAAARGVPMETVRDEALAKTSLGSLIAPEDIAQTIVFLASPARREHFGPGYRRRCRCSVVGLNSE